MVSAAQLKAKLKAAGMSQAGTKAQTEHRLSLFEKCKSLSLKVQGENPCQMASAALKKAAAGFGVSPIGNHDEILTELVNTLERTARAKGASIELQHSGDEGGDTDDAGKKEFEKRELMAAVIRLGEEGQHEEILCLGGTIFI